MRPNKPIYGILNFLYIFIKIFLLSNKKSRLSYCDNQHCSCLETDTDHWQSKHKCEGFFIQNELCSDYKKTHSVHMNVGVQIPAVVRLQEPAQVQLQPHAVQLPSLSHSGEGSTKKWFCLLISRSAFLARHVLDLF